MEKIPERDNKNLPSEQEIFGYSIHIGKGFLRLLAGKNHTEFRRY